MYKRGTPEYDRWKSSPEYSLYCERISAANKGKQHSAETRAKIGAANTGKYPNIEAREKMRVAHLGKQPSEETLVKLRVMRTGERNPFYGKHHIAETLIKMRAAKIGRYPSEETCAKMSVARMGERNHNYGKHLSTATRTKMSVARSGERHYMYGKHHSTETKQKLHMAQKGRQRPDMSGSNNHNWHGGISFEPYPIGWTASFREAIRKRDDYTCALCGIIQNGQRHAVHHIDYDKKNLLPENLITLCRPCHRKTNYNREYWINLFQMVYIPDFLELEAV